MTTTLPTFGTPTHDAAPRAAAYALIHDETHRVAVCRSSDGWFLPGGGCEEGENPTATLEREIREECARETQVGEAFGEAIEYVNTATGPVRLAASFWTAVFGPATDGQPEHELHWLTADEASDVLTHACHRWAVAMADDD